jgi:hypothetical protein
MIQVFVESVFFGFVWSNLRHSGAPRIRFMSAESEASRLTVANQELCAALHSRILPVDVVQDMMMKVPPAKPGPAGFLVAFGDNSPYVEPLRQRCPRLAVHYH